MEEFAIFLSGAVFGAWLLWLFVGMALKKQRSAAEKEYQAELEKGEL